MTTGGGREGGAFDLGFEGVDVFSVRRAGEASMNGQVRSAKHTPSGPRTLRTEYLLCAIYSSRQSHRRVSLLPLPGEGTKPWTGRAKVTQLESSKARTRTQATPKSTVSPLFTQVSSAGQRMPGRPVPLTLQEGHGVREPGARLAGWVRPSVGLTTQPWSASQTTLDWCRGSCSQPVPISSPCWLKRRLL